MSMSTGRSQGQSTAALPVNNGDRRSTQTVPRRRQAAGLSSKANKRTGTASAGGCPPPEAEVPWRERARQWLVDSGTVGYAFSFLFHAVALALCSVVLVEGMVGDDQFSTFLSEADQSEAADFDQLLDTRIEMAENKQDATNLPQLKQIDPPDTQLPPLDLTARLQSDVSDALQGDIGEGDGTRFALPPGGNAVTKGSFTAWTVPEDPTPDRYYLIVIQIKLPAQVLKYRSSDLQGLVRGTDRYEQIIPWDSRCPANCMIPGPDGHPVQLRRNGRLPVKDGVAQIVIAVPPGEKLVRDTIRIKSRMLNEEQTLQIVF